MLGQLNVEMDGSTTCRRQQTLLLLGSDCVQHCLCLFQDCHLIRLLWTEKRRGLSYAYKVSGPLRAGFAILNSIRFLWGVCFSDNCSQSLEISGNHVRSFLQSKKKKAASRTCRGESRLFCFTAGKVL